MKDFIIYEINYGEDEFRLYEEFPSEIETKFFQSNFENHAMAMNFLFDRCVGDNVDMVFNNNLDDISDLERFRIQSNKIHDGYDLVSSNFTYIDEFDFQFKEMHFSNLDLEKNLLRNSNIICHPSVCFSKRFIEENRYDPTEIPQEDLKLWKRSLGKYKMTICDEFLLKYRMHKNQITSSLRKNGDVKSQSDLYSMIIEQGNKIKENLCSGCGYPINRIKSNFCTRCNKNY